MGWFKNKCKLKHFKSFGESVPENMREIIEFSEYKHTHFPDYRIMECKGCGLRGYLGGMHCMGTETARKIDQFINRTIGVDELLDEFRGCGYRFIVHHNLIKETQ